MQDAEDGSSGSNCALEICSTSNFGQRSFYEAPTFDDDRPWGLRAKKFKDPAYGDVSLISVSQRCELPASNDKRSGLHCIDAKLQCPPVAASNRRLAERMHGTGEAACHD